MTYPLHIPQHLPALVGINEAHLLSQLRYLINLGKDDGISTDDDGRLWLAKKYSAWAEIFSWIKADTIGRLFNKLKRLGYLDIRQCRATNCFSLTAAGAALFDDYTPNIEGRKVSVPQSSKQGQSPSQTRKKAANNTETFRPSSIYNINNLIKDSSNHTGTTKEQDSDPHSIIGSAFGVVNHYDTSTDASWLFCQGEYELQLGKNTYAMWIADLQFVSFSDGTLTLLARNRNHQYWLTHNKAQNIIRKYSEIRRCAVNALQLVNPYTEPVTIQRRPQPPTLPTGPHVTLKPALAV